MSSGEDSALTLDDIRSCMRKYWRSLVFLQNSQFYQATSQPKWMKAILSHTIVGIMARNSGELDDSEASNFIRKNIGAKSHKIDAKLRYLYEELIKDDYRAIAEEEAHLHIVLSRCAYISTLSDSQIWGSTKQGKRISDKYKENLSGIKALSSEGEVLSKEIRSSLIASIGVKIGRQCLPYNYTSDDMKESNLPEILGTIDSVRLLTAAILIALNYQNNSLERRMNDETVDTLTKRIHKYLLSDASDIARGSSANICDEIAHQSEPVLEDDDDLLIKTAALARDVELKEIRTSIKRLVSKLIGNSNSDITNELKDVIYCCRRAHVDNLRFAIENLGYCVRLIDDSNKFSDDVHLSIILALIPLEIELIQQEIDALEELLRSCKIKFERERLCTKIESKYIKLDEKNKELKQYLHELERLQQEGLSKESVLSLHIPKRQDDN